MFLASKTAAVGTVALGVAGYLGAFLALPTTTMVTGGGVLAAGLLVRWVVRRYAPPNGGRPGAL